MAQYASKSEKVSPISLPADYARKMKEQPGYKWYKPILALLVGIVLYAAFSGIVELAKMLYLNLAIDPTAVSITPDAYMDVDFSDPFQVFLAVCSAAVMIPAAGIALKIFGLGGLRGLSSAEGGLRWRRILKLAGPVFILDAVLIVGISLIQMTMVGDFADLESPRFAPFALIAIILFVPFQCAAEEYVFRGFTLQTFASWIPVVVIPLILQSIVFGLMHDYNLIGNASVVISGLLYGWLAIKTGGIEAPICMHAANNVTGMLLACIWTSATVTTTTTIESAILDVAISVIVCAFTYYLCKRSGYVISDKPAEKTIEE